jgi:hypothetical protein
LVSIIRLRRSKVIQRPQRLPSNPTKNYDLGFKNGAVHGFDELRSAALSFLQAKYITDEDRPDRGTPEAEAILKVAQELSVHMEELKLKKIS